MEILDLVVPVVFDFVWDVFFWSEVEQYVFDLFIYLIQKQVQ